MKSFLILFFIILLGAGGWYFISPLFNTIEVNDEVPVALMPSGAELLSPEEKAAMDQAMAEVSQIPSSEMSEPMPTTEPNLSTVSEINGTIGHPAEGTVRVIETADGPVIRFEDFSTINGPQLHLYLAKDLRANEYIDLGPIRGTAGNINYQVPDDVDLSEYRYVMHWCVPFGVLFNYADLLE